MKRPAQIALLFLMVSLLFYPPAASGKRPLLSGLITFSDAEEIALENSHQIASQKYVIQSAGAKAFAEQVKILPNLDFGASSSFQSKIGKISIPALGLERDVGTHINWSVGPILNWIVWDTGQIWNMSKSLQELADSEGETLDYDTRQVLLNARTAYINVQLAREQVILVSDALQLARAQYTYVFQRKEAGTADLLDLTCAHQEVVDREKDLEQSEGNLRVAKRILVATLGFEPEKEGCDLLDVEPIENVLKGLLPEANIYVDIENHPKVKALEDQKRSSELAARSTIAQYFPKINLQGTSTYEYPNLGVNQTIQQNKLMLDLSVPILDWGTIGKESKSHKYRAYSTNEQKKQTIIDLSRLVSETREKILTLKGLRVANMRAVEDAVKVAQLSFESFKAGKIIFLDVQRANVKALSAKVAAAENDANLAVQVANLLALAEGEGGVK